MPRRAIGPARGVRGDADAEAGVGAAETIEYYALDAIGSVRVVFDQAGNVVTRSDYEPFGAPVSAVSSSEDIYAGLLRDEAGLDYAQARMYQRGTGRFNAPDPIDPGLFEPQLWQPLSVRAEQSARLHGPDRPRQVHTQVRPQRHEWRDGPTRSECADSVHRTGCPDASLFDVSLS